MLRQQPFPFFSSNSVSSRSGSSKERESRGDGRLDLKEKPSFPAEEKQSLDKGKVTGASWLSCCLFVALSLQDRACGFLGLSPLRCASKEMLLPVLSRRSCHLEEEAGYSMLCMFVCGRELWQNFGRIEAWWSGRSQAACMTLWYLLSAN